MLTRSLALRSMVAFGLSTALLVGSANVAGAHCEIPCGIYHDELRFDLIDEHLETIAKSMRQIEELSQEPSGNANQLTRWVVNKEEHAAQLRDIITVYFLDQRIKPTEPDAGEDYDLYLARLETLHRMLVLVMKCKQSTDLAHVTDLKILRDRFYTLYFGEGHERHAH